MRHFFENLRTHFVRSLNRAMRQGTGAEAQGFMATPFFGFKVDDGVFYMRAIAKYDYFDGVEGYQPAIQILTEEQLKEGGKKCLVDASFPYRPSLYSADNAWSFIWNQMDKMLEAQNMGLSSTQPYEGDCLKLTQNGKAARSVEDAQASGRLSREPFDPLYRDGEMKGIHQLVKEAQKIQLRALPAAKATP